MRARLGVVLLAAVVVGGLGIEPVAAAPVRIVSNYETGSGLFLHRDAGYSVPLSGSLAGHSLWLFGDTAVTHTPSPSDPQAFFLPGNWGAIGPNGPGVVPTVTEIPAAGTAVDTVPDGRGPGAIVPAPTGLLWPDGQTPCNTANASFLSYAASWPLGATAGPARAMTLRTDGSSSNIGVSDASKLVFMSVAEVCVVASRPGVPLTPPRGFESLDDTVWQTWPDMVIQRQVLVAYSPACVTVTVSGQPNRNVCNGIVAKNTLFRTTNGTALPWKRFLLGPTFAPDPVTGADHLYFNAFKCTNYAAAFGACIAGPLTAVRAPIASLHDPATYRWYTGPNQWGSEAAAVSMLPAGANGGTIVSDMHDFRSVGGGYQLLQQWNFGGGYQLWKGPTPAGPWTLARSGVMPGCQSGAGKGCYALVGHPELSTPGNAVYTFLDQTDGFLKFSTVGAVP